MSDQPEDPRPAPPETPEERSALDPQRLVEGAREGVEHLVEEVREEVEELHEKIEDVVEEHLPRRVRWTAGRIAWLIVGSLIAALALAVGGGLFVVARNTAWLAGELTGLLNHSLAQHSNLTLEVHDLRGNPFKQVELIQPRLLLRGRAGRPILAAPSMSVAYTPWSLVGRRRSIEITLDHPVIDIARGKDGRLVLPEWRAGPAGAGGNREVEIILHLRGGEVRLPDTALVITGWNADVRALVSGHSQIMLERMNWSRGPYGSRLDALVGSFTIADSVRFRVGELRSPDLALRAFGAWASGKKGGATRTIHADVEHVRWRWLARVFENGVFDVPGEGRGTVDASGDREWRGRVVASADWDSVAAAGHGEFAWARGRLRVEPLALSSPIGNLAGRLDYTADDWSLAGDVRRGDPARWRVIGLTGWPHGDLNGRMIFRSHRVGEDHASHLDATLAASDLGGWRADSATTTIEFPLAGADTFAVRMLRRGGAFTLLGRVEKGGWQGRYELSRYPLEEWDEGRASGLRGMLGSGRGTVEGTDSGLLVTGALEGAGTDWLGLHAAHWRLDELRGRLLPTPELAMSVRLRDLTFLGVHFDSSAAEIHLGDRVAGLDSVVAQGGDTTVAVRGSAAWDDHGWRVSLASATAQSRQFHWIAEPPLELAGDPHGVDFQRLVAHDGDARLEIAGRWAAPGGRYDWTAHATRLDLARLGLPLEWGVLGTANASLSVAGASGDPSWRLEAAASGPGFNDHRADTLETVLEGRRAELSVRRLHLGLGGGSLDGQLHFGSIEHAWPDTLTAGGVRAWLLQSGVWDGQAVADSLPLEHLDRLAAAARGWGGRLGGRLTIAGDPRHPTLDIDAVARPLRRDSVVVERVAARASYRDGLLTVAELSARRGAARVAARGTLPLTLDLERRPALPDRPMAWRVEIVQGDLSVLPLLAPQVAQSRGRIDATAKIEGTPRHPTLDGSAQVRGGLMVPAGREEVLEDVFANLHLSRSRITVDSLFAREGKRGQVTGHGVIELDGSQLRGYRLDVVLREFTVHEAGFYVAQVNGRVAITDGPKVAGHAVPSISGDVDLEKGVVVFDFANQAEVERLASTTQPLLWTYRIHMVATSNLHWQPPDGDIEFNADLTLEQTPEALNVFGDMQSLRGTYHFLSNRFTINRANLTFDNVGGLNPVLDIEAVTRIVPTQGATSASDISGAQAESSLPHQVTVLISGRSDRPTIEFQTDRGDWDQARVLQELTVGRFIDKNTVSIADPLDNYVTRMLNAQLDPLLSKAFMGYVSQWSLAREQGGVFQGQGELFVKVSSQVSPQLMMSYQQKVPGLSRPYASTTPVTSSLERNVEAEYRLNRFFYVTTGYTQRRLIGTTGNPGSLGGEFDVNLKARWEY